MCVLSHSGVSDSLSPSGPKTARLLCPWDSPGKNSAVGCHALPQGIFPTQGSNPGLPHCKQILYRRASREALVALYGRLNFKDDRSVQFSLAAQSRPILCNPMDCSMPGFPVHHRFPEIAQTHVHRVGDAIQ